MSNANPVITIIMVLERTYLQKRTPKLETQVRHFFPSVNHCIANRSCWGMQAGASLEARELKSLDELEDCELMVNCLGLGAALLFGDTDLYPVR